MIPNILHNKNGPQSQKSMVGVVVSWNSCSSFVVVCNTNMNGLSYCAFVRKPHTTEKYFSQKKFLCSDLPDTRKWFYILDVVTPPSLKAVKIDFTV